MEEQEIARCKRREDLDITDDFISTRGVRNKSLGRPFAEAQVGLAKIAQYIAISQFSRPVGWPLPTFDPFGHGR